MHRVYIVGMLGAVSSSLFISHILLKEEKKRSDLIVACAVDSREAEDVSRIAVEDE